ncbi:MAG: hypothetical protein RJA70_1617 [Pseudomonadota bacterium]|jgi:transcriptional regulator with XRE-family HTH domain
MDFTKLSQELVRALRGQRSQAALSRRLGFSTNVIYTWESGRRAPTALQFFALAEKSKKPAADSLAGFYRQRPRWLKDVVTTDVVTSLLEHERGRIAIVQVARDTQMSRFSLARYFRGDVDIRLPEFLRILDSCSHRLLDFLALWTDPALLPAAAQAWREQQLARRAAYERPWSHAVLRCLEVAQYRKTPKHDSSVVSKLLGIENAEVDECLKLLEESQQVRSNGTHWLPADEVALELGANPSGSKALAAWWLNVAAERAGKARRGMFAYNLCSVSAVDLQRIAELQRECLREIRSIVAHSQPGERVALIGVQVMGLEKDD